MTRMLRVLHLDMGVIRQGRTFSHAAFDLIMTARANQDALLGLREKARPFQAHFCRDVERLLRRIDMVKVKGTSMAVITAAKASAAEQANELLFALTKPFGFPAAQALVAAIPPPLSKKSNGVRKRPVDWARAPVGGRMVGHDSFPS